MIRWSDEEKAKVRAEYQSKCAKLLAREIDRTEDAVHIMAFRLGVKRYPKHQDVMA